MGPCVEGCAGDSKVLSARAGPVCSSFCRMCYRVLRPLPFQVLWDA